MGATRLRLATCGLWIASAACAVVPWTPPPVGPIPARSDGSPGPRTQVTAARRATSPRTLPVSSPPPAVAPGPLLRQVSMPVVTSWTATPTLATGSAAPTDSSARWSLGLWSGTDLWENEQAGWEPGYEVAGQSSMFAGELLSLSWGYGLSGNTALVATAAATRYQDVALSDAFEEAEFAWVALGVRFRF